MNRNLFIVTLITFVNALCLAVVIPIIYSYAKFYGMSDFESSLLLTIFSVSQFIATPIIGRLSDYFGRKPLLATSLFGTFLANILAAFAPTAGFLFAARMLDGITGGNNSVAQAVVSDTTAPEDRAKAYGLFGAAFGLAFIIGPVISLIFQNISLSAPYLVSAFFALVATLLTIFLLPETLQKQESKKITFGNLGFSQLVKGLFLPGIGMLLILNFLISLSFGIFQFGFQPYVTNVFSKTAEDISVILIIYGVVNVIMQAGVIRPLTARFNLISILQFSLISSALALSSFVLPQDYILFLFIIPLFAIANAFGRPIVISLLSMNARDEDQGIVMGVGESYFSLASAIGPVIGGLVVVLGYAVPLLAAASVSFIGLCFFLTIKTRLAANTKGHSKTDL